MYQTYWVELAICVYRHLPIFCQVFRMYQTYCVELTICVYRHLPTFLSSFSYVPDLLRWVGYLCLSSFTNLFVKFFVCTRLTALSWLFVLIVIYQPFCQVFRMYQTYCVELTICLSLFTNLFVKFFVCTRLTVLSWLFVFIVIYRSFCQVFVCTRLTALSWLFVFIVIYRSFVKFFVCTRLTVLSWLLVFIVIYRPFCQVFRMYQTYWVELAICVYRHLPIFLSSVSYVPDLLCWVGYLCLSSFTNLFVKFFVCTRLTGLSWLFVFIVIYRSFCQVFRMYQTYCVELTIWVFIVIYRSFCQVFRMYQTYWVELAICVYRHLPTFLSSFSYVPDLLGWGGYLCLSSFTDLFVKFFVCTRLTALSWLFDSKSGTYEKLDKRSVNDDKHK